MGNFDAEYKKVWDTLAEVAKRQAEAAEWREKSEKESAEWRKKAEKWEAEAAEWRKKADKLRAEEAEADKRRRKESEEWRRKMDEEHRKLSESLRETNQNLGGYTNNEAERLEEEFYEGICESMRVGGARLKEVRRRQRAKYEYDLVGINGRAVFVGEIKQNLHTGDVKKFAEERLPHFAEDFPGVARRRKIFGMVGGGRITPAAAKAAEKHGFLVLRLKNKKLVVDNAENARPVSH